MKTYIKKVADKAKPLFPSESSEEVGNIIEEILSILTELIGGCFTRNGVQPTVKDLTSEGGRFGTLHLNTALRRVGIPANFAKGRALKKIILDEAKTSKEDAEIFLSQCCPT